MTTTTDEAYDAGTGPGDFLTADDPPDDAPAALDGEQEAPYGWTRDRQTGELRPRAKPGRPRIPTPVEQIPATRDPLDRAEDQPPKPPSGRRPRSGARTAPDDGDVAMPKAGIIAAGVNKLYRRAGKILRAFDEDIGQAVIECTRRDPGSDDADELTVGEAWEALCKANPRIRRFVLKCIAGGAVGDLVMAHAPIGIAFAMKPWVQKLIPFGRLVESMGEPDEETGEGDLPGGMTSADVGELRGMAEAQARRMAERMGMSVPEDVMAAASERAMGRFEDRGPGVPPAFRAQPHRQSRATRRKAGR